MKNEEIERLNLAMKETSDKQLYERYLAVRLRLEGHTFAEIGNLLGRIRQTISNYWQSYQTQGLSGLEMAHSPGQPSMLTEEQRIQLAAMLEQKQPVEGGFEARYTWTLPLIAEWIKREYGVTMSVRGISAMLRRMNFSFTKATYTLANADEEAQAFVAAFIRFLVDLLLAYPNGKMVMILDNSRIHHATGWSITSFLRVL